MLVAEVVTVTGEHERTHDSGTHGSGAAHGGGAAHRGGAAHDAAVELFTPEFWDERYRSADALWSGNANPQLVAEASDLAPGRALDLGCGEGADAIWLATRGWHVTALDVSRVALERAATRAQLAGADVARRIDWRYADLVGAGSDDALASGPGDGFPDGSEFDLVSAQFIHLPATARDRLLRRAGALIAPGGTLLVVGHHPQDLDPTGLRAHMADLMYTPGEIAALLDPAQWTVVVAQARERDVVVDGETVIMHDAVMRAQRLA